MNNSEDQPEEQDTAKQEQLRDPEDTHKPQAEEKEETQASKSAASKPAASDDKKEKGAAEPSPTPSSTKEQKRRTHGRYKYKIESFEDLQKRFLACGRCGHFLTDYRVLHGLDALKAAVDASQDGWVDLTWDYTTKRLVYKSYGTLIESDTFHFEVCCPDCQRKFVYDKSGDESESLRAEVKFR